MERARHRKSKSTSGMDGNRQIQKQDCSRLSMDSRVYIDASTKNDMPFVLEFGQSTSGRATGTPMKKLLACELAKEVEPKRRSPSIIARLMGLEGLPSPSHVHRQHKWLSESQQPKNHSTKTQRNTLLYDGRSNSKSPMEQLEFKDVFEDLEASHVVNQRRSSRWSASSMLMKSEKVVNQQEFMDAKHLSADTKFQHLKEKDSMLLKFLEKPDSLVVKNSHDLQVNHSRKPSVYANYDSNVKAWKSARDISTKHDIYSHPNRKDGLLLDPHNCHQAHISCKSSKVRPEDNNAKVILPTRIVVLKPNLGKVQNAGAPLSPPYHLNDYLPHPRKMNGYSSFNSTELVSFGRKDSSYTMGSEKLMSNEAREKAREITRRMKDARDGMMDLMSSGFRGYAGDESSFDSFESESDSDSEMFRLSSRNSFDSRCGYPSSNSVNSHFSIETKKKLSERWKPAHRYQDAEIVTRERSLGEMLAKRDKEIKPNFSYAKTSLNSTSKELGSNHGIAKSNGPLGISSRDGRKDEIKKTSSRSRSLPPYIGERSQRRSTCSEALSADKNPVRIHSVSNGCSKVVKANLPLNEGTSSKDSQSRTKKPLPCPNKPINDLDSSLKANLEIRREAKIANLPERQPMFQTILEDDIRAIPGSDVIKYVENRSLILARTQCKLLPELDSSAVDKYTAAYNQEDTLFQEPHKVPSDQESPTLDCQGNELDSSESSKEADHFSPVSVLEIPFAEDATSNNDSFERVGAELRELRMQLQLLKMETGKYTEEVAQESPFCSEGHDTLASDTWESSYVFDVLIDSAIEESGLDILKTSWYTPECPLNPKLFNDLEKKYNYNTTVSECERKLLFDRMNSALLGIFQQHVDTCPWVMAKRWKLHTNLKKEELREAFEKLIGQVFADEQMPETVLDLGIKWFDSKEEIDVMGNEIEALLVDDLILEVFM